MTVPLIFGRDINSFNAYAPRPSDIKYSVTLALNTATSITLPETAKVYCVSFRYQPGAAVWVDTTGATASDPAGSTLASTTSELNPATLTLPAGATISIISSTATSQVSIVAWRIE